MTVQRKTIDSTLAASSDDLQALYTSLGAVTKYSLIVASDITLTQNTTQTSNIHLEFRNGAKIVTSTYTYACQGTHNDARWQLWDVSGGGGVTYTGMTVVRALWFDDDIDDCLQSLPSTGATMLLGLTTYGPTTAAYMKDNVSFIGERTPEINAGATALENGTIIRGPFLFSHDNIKISNLGIDSGSDVVTNYHSGVSQDALSTANVGQVVGRPTVKNLRIDNIVCLCDTYNSAVHAALIENVEDCFFSNIRTRFGTHGLVIKGIRVVGNNCICEDHLTDGVIIKNNAYAVCYDVSLSSIMIMGTSQRTGGLQIDNNEGSSDLYSIAVSSITFRYLTFGISLVVGSNPTKEIRDVSIVGDTYEDVNTITYTTGDVDLASVSATGNNISGTGSYTRIDSVMSVAGVLDIAGYMGLRTDIKLLNVTETDYDTFIHRSVAGGVVYADISNGGTWHTKHLTTDNTTTLHLVIGAYHLWVDSSGRLRIKNGYPGDLDTDGTIVGTQS